MDADASDAAPADYFFAEDDLLVFENLHVDTGPELPDEITDIHWLFADGFTVSVQLPMDLPIDASVDLPSFSGAWAVGDWLI